MKDLIHHLRAMNLIAHHFHNACSRVPFFQDHEQFASMYEAYDDDYDAVIERYIGKYDEECNLVEILDHAKEIINSITIDPSNNTNMFMILDELEQKLCMIIEEYLSSNKVSEGTKQLLGEICNQSEIRQYKIQQRIVK